jgi:hypothetical protein
VSGVALIDAMYPWLRDAPDLTEADVLEVIRGTAARQRIAALGVRYLADVAFGTSTSTSGGIGVVGGYGGGGFFGYKEWNKHETAVMAVLDLEAASQWRRDDFSRSYTSLAMPAFLIPIPIPMGPLSSVYEEVAKRLLPLLKPAKETAGRQ